MEKTYKIEFIETRKYLVTVTAKNQKEAKKLANKTYNESIYYDFEKESIKIGKITKTKQSEY